MVAEPVPETAGELLATVAPGYCSLHPSEQLGTAKAAGLRSYWYGHAPEPATICPARDHNDRDRERCRWCGGQLIPDGTARWNVSSRRLFCSANHRLKAFRAATR